jgi:hypothetical protein
MVDVIEGRKLCFAKSSNGPLCDAVQPVRPALSLAGVQKSKWKRKRLMRVRPELDPDVDDQAPDGPDITLYDEAHFVTYLRLLDAERDGAEWTEVARIVLHRDPACEELRTRRCFESHLARAQWMTKRGYRRLLEQSVERARRSRS